MGFGNREFQKPKMKKISNVIWEIPQEFKKGMRVPARIYASEKIVNDMDLQVYDQASNVATLPGIQKYSFVMPDGHSGYGFPIGGVAAFDVNEGGVISPGGIGFDVNCLPGNARISLDNGTWTTIQELDNNWQNKKLAFFDKDSNSVKVTNPLLFMKREEREELCEITTESGRTLRVTKDHPVLTEKGFVEAKNLEEHSNIFVRPFSGVKYEACSDEKIIDLKDIEKIFDKVGITDSGNAKSQIINTLKKMNLHDITYNSPQIPILLKFMGFIFGDGCIYFAKKNKRGCLTFYGKKEDLECIRKDLEILGFKAQQVYTRERNHKINTYYGKVEFNFKEESLLKKSTALAVLLVALGVPHGDKTMQPYRVPKWIMKAPLWQKRLFLASFFGAELSTPKTINKYNFYAPQLNMNKAKSLKENGEEFLNDVRLLLSEFGVTSTYPVNVEGNQYAGKKGKTIGLRILMHGNSENLIKLYELVGFEYNKQKSNLATLASNYSRIKEIILLERTNARKLALEIYTFGNKPSEIRGALRSKYISDHFINHSIWPDRSDDTRVPPNFISFEEYQKNLVGDGIVLDRIAKIDAIPFNGFVYDLTMNDKNHNFIADNIITHNCGMRLLLTNLTYDQIKPHLKALVNKLFGKIPAGVGGQGFVKLTKQKFKEVLGEGGQWAVNNGYGWKEDLERTELNGIAEWADVSKVSSKAIERGYNQIGTLGSGNHYVEIQWVKPENIADGELVKKWGIFPNQVVIMFHTGSRGEGHQIATDYLQIFLGVMERKYGIKILDRELACAPFNSPEGQDYWKAMACAVNFSFANRQTIAHRIREAFSEVLKQDAESLGMHQVFDVAHNRATLEKHKVDGELKELLIHRKGATGSYPAGREEIPNLYRNDGSPVIIGGSMETGSYLLVGGDKSHETFCSTAHGSGRTMSRTRAKQLFRGDILQREMEKKGIYVKSVSFAGLAEEAGAAYKDIDDVINATHEAGISKKVCKLIPIGNVKG